MNNGLIETTWQDVRFALRTLRRAPAFTITAIVTLALAIGGNTAMFTVIRAVLLKPLEYRDPDRLVRISGGATPSRFEMIKAGSRSFTGVGAHTGVENINLSSGGEPDVIKSARVSANFLDILSVEPMLGRGFSSEEDAAGAPGVTLISAGMWQRRFAGDPQIVGKTITLAGTPVTIIGVLPPGFQFPAPGIDVWLSAPSEWPAVAPASRALSPFLTIFGRVKPEIGIEQANAELRVIQNRYALAHPAMLDAKPRSPVQVIPLKDVLVSNIRLTLWVLLAAVALVLLIACANVTNLLLARATSRSREFAIRAAIGAGRARLIRQLLVESVLLSLAAGGAGVLLALWTLPATHHMASIDLPRAGEIHLDWFVLAFAIGLSTLTGIVFGLAPALGMSRPDLVQALRSSAASAGNGIRRRFLGRVTGRSMLVAGQVALSMILLIAAALLIQSVTKLRGVNLGFNPAGLLTMRITLPPSRYDADRKRADFYANFIQRIDSTPGIRSAAATLFLPMTGFAGTPVQEAQKPPVPLNERPIATVLAVTPDYFRTLDIPIRRGRDFSGHDLLQTQRVAIIDEGLARLFWPSYPNGQSPIGQQLLIGGVNPKPAGIIGIVAHVRENLEDTAWPASVYLAFAQTPPQSAMFAIRTTGGPAGVTHLIREQLRAMDRDLPLSSVQSMESLLDAEVGQRRLIVLLLATFAGVAVLMALIGLYGVVAYSVQQRTRELSIRRALGAQEGDILRLITREALVLTLAGVGVGLAGSAAATQILKSMLFQVSATDPLTFAVVAVLFILVAVAASYIPAQRGSRVEPGVALRA